MTAYEAEVTVQRDDGAQGLDCVKGDDPAVIAAWMRAQADRLDPPRRPMRRLARTKAEES